MVERKRWGGARKGAGRAKVKDPRRNRVVLLFTDSEHERLEAVAERLGVPIGTAARLIVARALARSK